MAPERDLSGKQTDSLDISTNTKPKEDQQKLTTSTSTTPEKSHKSAHLDDGSIANPSHMRLNSVDLDDEFDTGSLSLSFGSSQTDGNIWNNVNNRTDSTATDDSGIAAEFDYDQNATDDDEDDSILSNSCGLNTFPSSCSNVNQSRTVTSPVKSNLDNVHVMTTPTRRHRVHQSSTEDSTCSAPRLESCSSPRLEPCSSPRLEPCSSPRSPSSATWSPQRRSSATEMLAERRRKRSQGDIGKRRAWLMERTENALEKSATVRRRSEDLIRTGKRLRNEEI